MRITGLTVCVDYAEHLAKSIQLWKDGLDEFVVITSFTDWATEQLCRDNGVVRYPTGAFWSDGAKFNKGRAIAEAFEELLPRQSDNRWILFFDSDIEPPKDWMEELDDCESEGLIHKNYLHGAFRCDPQTKRIISDPDIAGFFHLAHTSCPHMKRQPIVDVHWYHAGNYDSTFQNRWPKERRIRLPLMLIHHGEPGKNWCGVGHAEDVKKLHAERKKRRGRWDHETV